MSQIFLVSDYEDAPLDRTRRTVWLHHDRETVNASRSISLSKFLDDPRASVADSDLLVVCGLVTKICTPSNRVKLGQFLTEPWWGPPRVSVDTCLFVGDPWRMWWHWGCVGRPFANYFTSYRLESDWKRYVETDQNNPCTIERIAEYGNGIVEHRNGFSFSNVRFQIQQVSSDCHERYAETKELAFLEEKTVAGIIRRLTEFCQSVYPDRFIPRNLFSSQNHNIRITDLGVDAYIAKRIRDTVSLTNAIAEMFAC